MFNIQPVLYNKLLTITPLTESDYQPLFKVAADPLLWEQHPNSDRYKPEVFSKFFEEAIASKGAFLVSENDTKQVVGCSRFYDFNDNDKSIYVGYIFIARKFWGKEHNKVLKELMFNYAFQFVDFIFIRIANINYRSQKAAEKLGALKIAETETLIKDNLYLNFTYQISKTDWVKKQQNPKLT